MLQEKEQRKAKEADEAMSQEKKLSKAKEAEAKEEPIKLYGIIDPKKEIFKDMFIIVPDDITLNSKDLLSKTNLAFEGENIV